MSKVILGKDYDFYVIDKYYSRSYAFYNLDEYYNEDDEVLPRPHKVIGKPCGAKIRKKHIYFHCRSMLK